MKRIFGSLAPQRPIVDMSTRIFSKLDETCIPSHVRIFTALRNAFAIPDRRMLAKLSVGIVAVMLIMRSGAVNVNAPYLVAPIMTASNQEAAEPAGLHVDPVAKAISYGTSIPSRASFVGLGFVEGVEAGGAFSHNATVGFLQPGH
jgi:hypothetical protein